MCAFVVLGLVFHTKPTIWLGNISEMTYFVGTTTQSTGHEVAKLQTELLLSLDYYS